MNSHRDMKQPSFKDVSRFTRWINGLDEKDRLLSPRGRKKKWVIFLCILFLLFVLSFTWFPRVTVEHQALPGKTPVRTDTVQFPSGTGIMELPADSLEHPLKQKSNEDTFEAE
ncbi:hypothetical protein SAMN05444274_101149 [Mariniphaga anaerophila]|uniref:Uncharacterized protein n=1 Tax=Mariniphaga anaerophila TaxID=1484053 RepID=A0A1M4SU14_9BACT|nr:hypothetical protein [Mariniphaga anaerophila]SHE35730.1 hypothetical protein SAMN05444274_101149 [Mariniphaga anaerophila]